MFRLLFLVFSLKAVSGTFPTVNGSVPKKDDIGTLSAKVQEVSMVMLNPMGDPHPVHAVGIIPDNVPHIHNGKIAENNASFYNRVNAPQPDQPLTRKDSTNFNGQQIVHRPGDDKPILISTITGEVNTTFFNQYDTSKNNSKGLNVTAVHSSNTIEHPSKSNCTGHPSLEARRSDAALWKVQSWYITVTSLLAVVFF